MGLDFESTEGAASSVTRGGLALAATLAVAAAVLRGFVTEGASKCDGFIQRLATAAVDVTDDEIQAVKAVGDDTDAAYWSPALVQR